jgi:hypothetical protein
MCILQAKQQIKSLSFNGGCIFVHATVALRPFFTPDRIKVWKIQHTSARTGIHSSDASCRIQAEGCGFKYPLWTP